MKMIKMWTCPALATAALLALAAPRPASASPLDPAHVPAEAKWVIHVDLSALSETELAQRVREQRPRVVEGVRQWLNDRYGIDSPREDFDSLTMFSESYESHSGSTILKANYDRQKVQSKLESKEGVESESWMDHTLYSIHKAKGTAPNESDDGGEKDSDDGDDQPRSDDHDRRWQDRSFTVVLFDDQTVIFASSTERAKAAVKLLQGDSPSLKGKDSPLLAELPDGALLYGAAVDLQSIDQHEGIFPILSQHERIVWAIGQQEDEVYEHLTLVAKSPEVAEQMKTTIDGFVALMKLWAADNQMLSKLMQATQVELDDRTVNVKWRGKTGDVVAALEEVRKRVEKRFGRPHHDDHHDDDQDDHHDDQDEKKAK